MTKILDYLVENYIYVAAISGFFIIVLIGYLVRDKRKKGKKDNKKTEVESNVVPIDKKEESAEKTQIVENNNENIVFPIEETNTVDKKMDFVKEVEESVIIPVVENIEIQEIVDTQSEVKEITQEVSELPDHNLEVQSFDVEKVEPSYNKFQVVLEPQDLKQTTNNSSSHNEIEIFDLDDTIVFDKRKLDAEIDIVDFSDINKFQTNDQIPNPINKDN